MTRSIFEMVILIAISIALSFAGNAINPNGIPFFGHWSPEKGSVNAGGPCAPDSNEITDIDMMDLYLSSGAVFVDARSIEDYSTGHIPRAINLPPDQIEDDIFGFMETYPPNTKIIVYCSGIDCQDSHDFAKTLKEYKYLNVVVYSLGMEEWKNKGRPIETSQTEGTE
ncbi:rhodanese-like domain-containing protein [bacterium]|nr:rhodanese-like domain-containing protein [bacterium]